MRQVIRFFAALMILAGSVSFFIAKRPDLLQAASDFLNGSRPDSAQPSEPLVQVPAFSVQNTAADAVLYPPALAIPLAQSCVATPTSLPTVRAQVAVYQWVDERGRTHFGDRPPENVQAEELALNRAPQMDYFQLAIDYGGVRPVPFLQDRLSVSIEQIYEILAELVGRERLRAVEVNVTILPDRQAFLEYGGDTLAYSISGFYTAASNEAVTWQHDDQQLTLEVAKHESVHVIMAGLLGAGYIPLWLNEGLAEYFELMETRAQFSEVPIDTGSLQFVQTLVARNQGEALGNFMKLDPQGWSAKSDVHYPMAATLVYFLMDTQPGKTALAALLQNMADNYCRPPDQIAVLDNAYPGGVASMERDFLNWVSTVRPETRHQY